MNHEKELREALENLIKASISMFNGGLYGGHQTKLESIYNKALDHAQKTLLKSKTI